MRSKEIKPSHLKLLPPLDTTSESEIVYSHFGHPSQGLTITQSQGISTANRLRQLSVLLNYLESEVATLQFKLLEVCSTWNIAIEDPLAEQAPSTIDTTGTEEESE